MSDVQAAILTICAWCERVIAFGPSGPKGEVSHGVCPDCISKVRAQLRRAG